MLGICDMIERDRDATESCDGTPALDLSPCVAFSDIAGRMMYLDVLSRLGKMGKMARGLLNGIRTLCDALRDHWRASY